MNIASFAANHADAACAEVKSEEVPFNKEVLLEKPQNVVEKKGGEKKRRRQKKWKRPKSKPARPLSAYNLFFQEERATMLGDDAPTPEQESLKKRVHCKTHGKIGFIAMARAIGRKWRSLDSAKRKEFEDQAKILKEEYASKLLSWKESQKESKGRGLDAIATAAMESDPIGSNTSPCSTRSKALDSLKHIVSEGFYRNNLARPQGLAYMRPMQYCDIGRAALLDLPSVDASLLKSPSAAEASANAILQYFQGNKQTPTLPIQTSQSPHVLMLIDYHSLPPPIHRTLLR